MLASVTAAAEWRCIGPYVLQQRNAGLLASRATRVGCVSRRAPKSTRPSIRTSSCVVKQQARANLYRLQRHEQSGRPHVFRQIRHPARCTPSQFTASTRTVIRAHANVQWRRQTQIHVCQNQAIRQGGCHAQTRKAWQMPRSTRVSDG
jgi:hypothetical protein